MNRGLQMMSKEISPLEQQQIQKLTEIGDYLRQMREESLLSLEQMATKTLIQARLLNAIETGKLHQLPEPVYIRGFIKRYADALGLDGTEIGYAFPINTDMRSAGPSWKNSAAAQLRPLHLWAAYVLLIMAAVGGLSNLVSRSASWVSSPISTDQSAAPSPAAPNSNPAASAVPSSSPSATDKPVRVDVTLTAQSWLRVVIDGKTEYEGVMSEGTQRTWTANSELTVRAGNAGGVMLAYNQGQAERMGEPGTVKEVTFSPTQDAASLPRPTNSLPQ